jgi:diaminopimelate epimerase
MQVIKAHAYGNDFLFVRRAELGGVDLPAAARRLCDRHRGAGGDGLILYDLTPEGAAMRLINADGSAAELSGNGLRALAALVIRHRGTAAQVVPGAEVVITTDAGPRPLTLVGRSDPRFTFRAGISVGGVAPPSKPPGNLGRAVPAGRRAPKSATRVPPASQ